MKISTIYLPVLFASALVASACGASDAPLNAAPTETNPPTANEPATAAPPSSDGVAAALSDTELGSVMVGPDGRTLYGFTNDTEAASTCYDACADAWPPVIVDKDWAVAPGLDVGIFATTTRDDGSLQLVAGKWPLYYYAADTKPGDVSGQGSGDVWFVVAADGSLVKEATATETPSTGGPVSSANTELGDTLVDEDGLTLYGFTNDTDGETTCVDDCADAWPPLIVDSAELPAGLDAETYSVIERPDGTFQLKAGKWPLYTFAADQNPGDVNGQGSGDVWFVVAPDGSLIKDGAESAPASSSDASSDQRPASSSSY